MVGKRDFEDTIRTGERNRDTARLLANWCAHARLNKFGGVGLIEAETGLPIGNHGVVCEHAPAGGMMCWELRDSVIDFYDRNCSVCTKRKPVGFPNISEIIGERDRERAARLAQEAARAAKTTEELCHRDERRAELAPTLDAVNRTILDDISVFDRNRSAENLERLVGIAQMAPERFQDHLKDYIVALAETQAWFTDAGVIMLYATGGNHAEIVRLALRSFARGAADQRLIEVILEFIAEADEVAIRQALAAIVELAESSRDIPFGPAPREDNRLLLAVWRTHRVIVLDEIEIMLSSRRRRHVERSGRLLSVVQTAEPGAANAAGRSLTSTYVRAGHLIDDLEDEFDNLPRLGNALFNAFLHAPEVFDALLEEFATGSDTKSGGRVYNIYAHLFGWMNDDTVVPADSTPHRIALKRLIWGGTKVTDTEVLQTIGSAFHHMPERFGMVIRSELQGIFGASLLVADRLAAIDAEVKPKKEDSLERMERRNQRTALAQLMSNLLESAAASCVGHTPSMEEFLALMDSIPEDREELRGRALSALQHFATNVEGLRKFLPRLYSSIVGPSVTLRMRSAYAIGELRYRAQSNMPPLVFEVFCALLTDPYVAVHKAAVRTLRLSSIPPEYGERVAHSLLNLIAHYRTQSHEDAFLVSCIDVLDGMVDEFGSRSKAVRRYLIEVAMGVDPVYLRSEMSSFSHTLGLEPSFGRLAARMLPTMTDRFNHSEEVERLIDTISIEAMKQHASEFKEVAVSIAHDDLQVSLRIVEKMSRNSMMNEALELTQALINAFEDNAHFRSRRLSVRRVLLGLELERAAAEGDTEAMNRIKSEWEAVAQARAADKKESQERGRRSSFPFAN